MLYDKILVAVDGSQHSNKAIKEAIKVAKFTGGQVTLIHVYPLEPLASTIVSPSQELYKIVQNDAKTLMGEAKKLAETENPAKSVTGLLLEGDAAEQIVKTAHKDSYDLIVIGARGLGKLSGLILGSVSQGVVKDSPCPVLITK